MRRAGDAFGDSYTFPGGVLDADECDAREFCSGLTADEADAILKTESGGLDYYIAVVRELFEETGVLLGASAPVDDGLRDQLHSAEITWPDLLRHQKLTIPCDSLHYFTHWITPEALPKRWSTRFFLARMPADQYVRPDGSEITDYCWVTAGEALKSAACGDREIPFPTRRTIESMAHGKSAADLVDWARKRQAEGVPAILPEIRAEDGKRRIFLPEIGD